ncbi:MAG TPA: sugar ABC transporter permease [Candidatus Rokubacteria bacterium]|nr:MAG: glycerol-3-phosphate ABC transporter permease [Candidatus Rokubacteria bacterium GWA2_73_35]HBH01368.1 sugar ABC transporter permease [Candidatus Rokubacteria bacterium]
MEGRFPGRALPYALLLPSIAVIAVFLFVPAIEALRLSLFEVAPFTGRGTFVGLANFRELVGSGIYRHSLSVTLLFAVGVVALGLAGSLAVAVLASLRLPGVGVYRTVLLWPYALSPAVAGTIWALLFDPSTGPMTVLLRAVTGLSPNWMMDGTYALGVTVVAAAWKMLGFNIVFFLAGLQAVPQELQEAARVDGAGGVRVFWRITFPILSPVTFFLFVMNSLYAFFEVFGLIDVMTQGGPGGATDILVYRLYQDAFISARWGIASAQSILLFAMVGVLMLIQFRLAGRRVVYA